MINSEKQKLILIDALYIHNGGGKVLLDLLINKLIEMNLTHNLFFLFDSRYNVRKPIENHINFLQLESAELSRFKFYQKNKFKSILCFANVPPPVKIKVPVSIYFHNDLLIKPFNSNLKISIQLVNFIKKLYINLLKTSKYTWIVQTNYMKSKLKKSYKINSNNILIFPFFSEKKPKKQNLKEFNSFFYPSNNSRHKNHENLAKALVIADKTINLKTRIYFTIPDNEFNSMPYIDLQLNNIQIINLGTLSKTDIDKTYQKVQFLLFPSIKESFGLPLIEAINHGCKVIASDLDYVHEIVIPSITFNPSNPKSISDAIKESLNSSRLDLSKVIVENKIDTFVKYIFSNV